MPWQQNGSAPAATAGGNVATPHAPVDGKVRPIQPFDSDNTNPAGGVDTPLSWITGTATTYDVLLGRPTDSSIAVSVLATGALDAYGGALTHPGHAGGVREAK